MDSTKTKRNIDIVPFIGLPVDKAYTCIVCSGPQGIGPFNKLIRKGLLVFSFPLDIFTFLKGITPSMERAIKNMIVAASKIIIPDTLLLLPISLPRL